MTSLHSFDPSTWREGPDGATKEAYGGGKIASVTPEEDDEGYGGGGEGGASGMESGMAVVRVRGMSSSSVQLEESLKTHHSHLHLLRGRSSNPLLSLDVGRRGG